MYLHGKCTCIGNVLAWEMYLHGKCTYMGNVPAWEMYLHWKCTCMGNELAWEMYLHGKLYLKILIELTGVTHLVLINKISIE